MFTRSHILKIVFFVGTVVLFISCGVFKTNASLTKTDASLTDVRDGKTYKTVKIGSQVWMAENLNYEYNEGTARSYCYDDDPAMCEKYGRLYTWAAAMDSAAVFSGNGKGCGYGKTCSATKPVRGVCPAGWHLPSTYEWNILGNFIAKSLFGGNADSVDYALKATSDWTEFIGETSGSDAFGFGALPAGGRNYNGAFNDNLIGAYFWSSTEKSTDIAYFRDLASEGPDRFTDYYKNDARSVRCAKDGLSKFHHQ